MIDKFVLKDFQSHRRVEVILDPAVTTLIGDNDAGKTSLIRALMLTCLNSHTSPDRFIRLGKSRFSATLHVDGSKVERRKGKGVNLYLLNGKKLRFDSMRVRVPAEVEDLLKVGRENFQLQHDLHFWFSDTPGQVSKRLNEIVNLSQIDTTLDGVAAAVREAKSNLATQEQLFKEAKGRVRGLAWVPAFARGAARLGELGERAESCRNRAGKGRSLAREGESALRGSKRLSEAYTHGKRVVKLGKLAGAEARKLKRAKELFRKLTRLSRIADMEVPDVSALLAVRDKADKTAERRRYLEHTIEDLDTNREEVWRLNEELAEAEKRLRTAERKKGKCPACGQSLSQSSVRTSTSATEHLCRGRKKTGTKSSSGT